MCESALVLNTGSRSKTCLSSALSAECVALRAKRRVISRAPSLVVVLMQNGTIEKQNIKGKKCENIKRAFCEIAKNLREKQLQHAQREWEKKGDQERSTHKQKQWRSVCGKSVINLQEERRRERTKKKENNCNGIRTKLLSSSAS